MEGTFAALFDQIADGVCVTNAAGEVLYANPAARRLLGAAAEGPFREALCDALCARLSSAGRPECASRCPLRDPRSSCLGVTFEGEHAEGKRDLRVRCLRMGASWSGGDENADKHLALIEDASAEMELKRRRDDWRSMIAHDLRAPLSSILGALSTVRESDPGRPISAEEKGLLDIGIRSARRMLELLNDHLDVAKLDSGMMPVEPEAVEAAPLLAECAEEQAPLASERGVAVEIRCEAGVRAWADPALLRRIVQNLLNNALKFTPRGGRVVLSAAPEPRGTLVRVQDDGAGIAPEDLPRIFDRYYQAKARRAGRIRGIGLGLTFCQEAARAMGGDIWVESAPGKGSAFTLRLPVKP